jgi:hypothetical protein
LRAALGELFNLLANVAKVSFPVTVVFMLYKPGDEVFVGQGVLLI